MPLPAAWGDIRRTSEAATPVAAAQAADEEPEALRPLGMRKGHQHIAQAIRLFEQEHEEGDHSPGNCAHD